MSRNDRGFPVCRILHDIFAIPHNLLIGFAVGVVAPVAAIAAMVAGVRLLTGKVPFLTPEEDDEGENLEPAAGDQSPEGIITVGGGEFFDQVEDNREAENCGGDEFHGPDPPSSDGEFRD